MYWVILFSVHAQYACLTYIAAMYIRTFRDSQHLFLEDVVEEYQSLNQ